MSSKIPSKEEVNEIAKEFVELRDKIKTSKKEKNESKFEEFRNNVVKKLSHLVLLRTNRYRMFNNYHDLQQDGFEALFMALKTYRPEKGDFSWWAKKYIDTRISRAANCHSTIKFPLKKAREMQPHKVSTFPIIIDLNKNPHENAEAVEIKTAIMDAIKLLPEKQRQVILMSYELTGTRSYTISKISEELKISRTNCINLIEMAKENLKLILSNKLEDMGE